MWRNEKNVYIEIQNVRLFAHGGYDDGTIDVWAEGRAGWFLIRPAREYRNIYNDMAQAVGMLHCLEDKYAGCRKKGRKMIPGTVEEAWERVCCVSSRPT